MPLTHILFVIRKINMTWNVKLGKIETILLVHTMGGIQLIIEPKIRGFICTTAHPDGCAAQVKAQVDYVKNQPPITGPKRVLVVGASTGYGLSSRIVSTFGA